MHTSNRLVRLVAILTTGGLALGVCFVALAPGVETLAASARYSGKVAPLLRPLEGPTILYDRDGNVIDRLGNLDRSPVSLNAVPKVLRDAVIATEDRTFYTNPGVDVRSAVRALVENVDAGQVDQGGSTITQQLIKNRYFKHPRQTLDRKVREAVLATRLTNEWSKRRILQEYLNTVYFGENAYGVNAASLRIIGKPLEQLDLGDAALLAGLIKDPSRYDPFSNPENAQARKVQVLSRMREQHEITKAEATLAAAEPLPPKPQVPTLQAHSPYAEEVKNRLLELPELGATEQEAAQRVFAGGLRVYTAFDQEKTFLAQSAVDSTVGRFAPFTASMAVMNPRTGEVLAIAGGKDPQGFNLATMGPANTNGRQVGSNFKPITLATAFTNGYSPNDLVNGSSPCFISYEPWGYHRVRYRNAGGGGTDTLYSQTKNSVNCAFLNLFTSVGPQKVLDMAENLGTIRPNHKYLSTTIGDDGHSPLEMATVYSTFASEGVEHDPIFIKRVEDTDGQVLYHAPAGRRALSPQVARTVTDVLSHVTEGTGKNAKLPDDRPMAGKTGTRDEETDAWFTGYTPQLVASVWMGHPGGSIPMPRLGGVTVFGGSYPAMIWERFMSAALKDAPMLPFTPPDPSLWPKPAIVNPAGGRGKPISTPTFTPTTSSTLPPDTAPTPPSTPPSTTEPVTTPTSPSPPP